MSFSSIIFTPLTLDIILSFCFTRSVIALRRVNRAFLQAVAGAEERIVASRLLIVDTSNRRLLSANEVLDRVNMTIDDRCDWFGGNRFFHCSTSLLASFFFSSISRQTKLVLLDRFFDVAPRQQRPQSFFHFDPHESLLIVAFNEQLLLLSLLGNKQLLASAKIPPHLSGIADGKNDTIILTFIGDRENLIQVWKFERRDTEAAVVDFRLVHECSCEKEYVRSVALLPNNEFLITNGFSVIQFRIGAGGAERELIAAPPHTSVSQVFLSSGKRITFTTYNRFSGEHGMYVIDLLSSPVTAKQVWTGSYDAAVFEQYYDGLIAGRCDHEDIPDEGISIYRSFLVFPRKKKRPRVFDCSELEIFGEYDNIVAGFDTVIVHEMSHIRGGVEFRKVDLTLWQTEKKNNNDSSPNWATVREKKKIDNQNDSAVFLNSSTLFTVWRSGNRDRFVIIGLKRSIDLLPAIPFDCLLSPSRAFTDLVHFQNTSSHHITKLTMGKKYTSFGCLVENE